MTIIDCLKRLFKEDDINPLSPEELRIYITLLKEWNRQGRPEWFEYCLIPKALPKMLPNVLPKMTISRTREKLSKRGLIQYVSGNGKVKNPCYKINDVTNLVTKDVTNPVTNSKEKVSPTPPLKENISEFKEKERIPNGIPKKAELSSSEKSERMDCGAFMQTFNDMLSPAIPKVTAITETRRKKVKTIVKDFGEEKIMEAFDKIRKSDFLMGRNRKPNDKWQCCFDWIFTTSNFIKILEGNYDNGAYQTNYSEKRSINAQALADFLAEREQRASGMVVEVEKPF